MSCFVDTAALLAILDADDQFHTSAAAEWQRLLASNSPLVTSNYVLVETLALLQHRFGIAAVRTLQDDIVPVLQVEWIDAHMHAMGVAAVLAAARKRLSLVDCVSFALMRQHAIRQAFTVDRHFREQGFQVVPARVE